MTATTSQPTQMRKPRPILDLARRLTVQAVLSVTVMAGLQLASVNGYDIRDLLPAPASDAARPAEPASVVGAPVRAAGALDRIMPEASASAASSPSADAPSRKVASAVQRPAPMAARPGADRVAVPTPRPRLATARPAAVPPPPGEMPFDVTPHGVETYGIAELGTADVAPVPILTADAGFRVRDLVPSGEAILTRTAEVTGSAAQAVTGTATRLLDLVR